MSVKRDWGVVLSSAADTFIDRISQFASATKGALLVGGALFAYLNQPLMKFVDVYPAYEGALVTTLALILLSAGMNLRRHWFGIFFGFVALYIGLMWIADGLQVATQRAAFNDRRCWRIETEMLSSKPPRNDLADIYQALGCRPLTDLYQPSTTAIR